MKSESAEAQYLCFNIYFAKTISCLLKKSKSLPHTLSQRHFAVGRTLFLLDLGLNVKLWYFVG